MTSPFPPAPTTNSTPASLPPVPERYRALILSFGGVLFSALLSLSTTMQPGAPLGGVGWLTIAVAAITSLGVYFPANPWAKCAAAAVGVVGQVLVSSAQGGFTLAETLTVVIMVLSAMGIGSFPNDAVVGEAVDVRDEIVNAELEDERDAPDAFRA